VYSLASEKKAKYRVTVMMKKPWSDRFFKKPTKDMILEALVDGILRGELDELFEIKIEELE